MEAEEETLKPNQTETETGTPLHSNYPTSVGKFELDSTRLNSTAAAKTTTGEIFSWSNIILVELSSVAANGTGAFEFHLVRFPRDSDFFSSQAKGNI